MLVPPGFRSALLCRYRGLEPWPFSTLPHSCPFDDASQVIAHFGYPSGATSAVTVDLMGCNTVTNGRIDRTAYPADPVLAELERLTR